MTEPSEVNRDLLTREEMEYGAFTLGNSAEGEMAVFDGDLECSGCSETGPEGETIYWRGSNNEYDAYCVVCAREDAQAQQAYCMFIDHHWEKLVREGKL